MRNKEKFLALVNPKPSNTVFENEKRLDERYWKRISVRVALVVMDRAEELGISFEEVNEFVGVNVTKGKSNLTLADIVKLEHLLNFNLLNLPDYGND
jgi:hypothetical protein